MSDLKSRTRQTIGNFKDSFGDSFKSSANKFMSSSKKKLRNLTDSARKKLDVFEGNVSRFGERKTKTITTSEDNLLNISNRIFDIKILCDKKVVDEVKVNKHKTQIFGLLPTIKGDELIALKTFIDSELSSPGDTYMYKPVLTEIYEKITEKKLGGGKSRKFMKKRGKGKTQRGSKTRSRKTRRGVNKL